MKKIVIDTNIFLGLYRSNNDTLRIFEDIEKFKPHLILSDQIFDEFLRNRDVLILDLIKKINKSYHLDLHSTSLIRESSNFKKILKLQESLKLETRNLIKEFQTMLDNPEKDPIYTSFKKLFESSNVEKLLRNDRIIEKAEKRKLIGNPPTSLDKNSLGDEIIWELIINNVKNDLIIITRDETYSNRETFLKNEFAKKTGKKLIIEENISNALKKFGETASDETLKFEKTLKIEPSDSWQEILLRNWFSGSEKENFKIHFIYDSENKEKQWSPFLDSDKFKK